VAALESHRTEVLKLQANADRERQSLAQKHDEAERRHTAELAAVTDRVTSTINRKDGQIRQLQEDVATLEHALQSREAEMARHTALLGDVNNDDRDGSQCLDDFE
jgi:chromosome segregation ATPase